MATDETISTMQSPENSSPEFDSFGPAYDQLLDDPMRNRFARDPLHFHRRKWLLMQALLKRARVAPETQRWLDVGCGQGELLSLGGSHFASAMGCDPSANMLRPNASFQTYVQTSLVKLPFEDASVDFVTTVCVYHHVHGEARTLLTSEIKRVLSPGGLCCIIEHNPWNPVTRGIVKRCAVDVDAELLTARETDRLFSASGFRTVSTDYFLYLPESLFSSLGAAEKMFSKVPLGGQYALLAQASA
jgi:ubiquinone/menaquinone biosynthesis C-methylase UbiE